MSDHIRDEWVEKAAKALADDWNPDRDPILSAMFLDYAQTALSAVADDIRADALREAAGDPELLPLLHAEDDGQFIGGAPAPEVTQ